MNVVEVKANVELSDVLDEVKIADVIDHYGEDCIVEEIVEKVGPKVIFETLTVPEILRGLADKIEEELKKKNNVYGR
jgi:hypothetical protein